MFKGYSNTSKMMARAKNSKGKIVTAGIIDTGLPYCPFVINCKGNKNSFPDCLLYPAVERLKQNVAFGMQISCLLLFLKTKYLVPRNYKQ